MWVMWENQQQLWCKNYHFSTEKIVISATLTYSGKWQLTGQYFTYGYVMSIQTWLEGVSTECNIQK